VINLRKITEEKNVKVFGIVWGIILGIVVIGISIALTFFLIYHFQPSFLCDLCKCPCEDILIIP